MNATFPAPGLRQAWRDLDTPALLVDLDAMDANIARIAATCAARHVQWRPHVKSHAIPELALRLVAAGAIGVTCAKLGEAEAMAAAGVRDILVANQIVGARKLDRLTTLARHADVIVTVDDATNAERIAAAARDKGVVVRVLVEVDIGMQRAGVRPGEAAVTLARHVAGLAGVRFAGFEAWEGHTSSMADAGEKARAIVEAVRLLSGTAAMCAAQGIPVAIVSCGGTSTFELTTAQSGVTEVQAGGGIFGDMRCREVFRVDLARALTLASTVISRPSPTRIVCDVGKKSISPDPLPPRLIGVEGVRKLWLSAEHATLDLDVANAALQVGDKVEFEVGYSDSTIHLHDELYGVRNGRVEVVWRVGERGKAR